MHKWQPGNIAYIVNGGSALSGPVLESTTIKRIGSAYVDLAEGLGGTKYRVRVSPSSVFRDARSAWLAYAEKMDGEAKEHEEQMHAAQANAAEARKRAEES